MCCRAYLCGVRVQGALHQTQILALQMWDVQTASLGLAGPLQAPAACLNQSRGIKHVCTSRLRPMGPPRKQWGIAAATMMARAEQPYSAAWAFAQHYKFDLRKFF
jgi:hypothetical protein